MVIGISNNCEENGKKYLKEFFINKGYFYLDCDEYLKDSLELLYNHFDSKHKLDDYLEKTVAVNDYVVIDYTDLCLYNDYIRLCDLVININPNRCDNILGIKRVNPLIINNNPELFNYHLEVNINKEGWKEILDDFITFNFDKKYKVTVVVPVYNAQMYLKKCINSILDQSYKNIEIILVDDGSTDDSGIICDNYCKVDERIKVIHKNNKGLSDSRNVGKNNATGDYILFVDADDYIENNMVELMLKNILKNKSDICECGFFIHNKDGSIIDKCSSLTVEGKLTSRYDLIYAYVNNVSIIASWNKLYKLSSIKKFDFDVSVFKEDTDYTFRLYENELSLSQISMPLYHYVKKESNSLTGNTFNERFFNLLDWSNEACERLKSYGEEYNDAIDKIMYNTYVHLLKYYLRDFNKNRLKEKEYRKEIVEIYNSLVKLLINTINVEKYRALDNILGLLNIYLEKGIISKEEVYTQKLHCIGIIWNSLNYDYRMEILDKIKEVGSINEVVHVDLKDKYEDFIKDIYVENHEAEGVTFIKFATLYNQFDSNEFTIVNFDVDVDFYEYTNKLKGYQFFKLAELKRNIRKEYKTKIKYAFDNVFHLTMNIDEYDLTNEVIKKYVSNYKGE